MNSCVSGKRMFESKELAEEALIQNHIMNNHREGSGPINIYECMDCSYWHFTSNGIKSSILNNPEIVAKITRERRAKEWEYRFK